MDIVIIQYCQGRPKQAQNDEGFRDVVVQFLVWFHKADYDKTQHDQQTVDELEEEGRGGGGRGSERKKIERERERGRRVRKGDAVIIVLRVGGHV